MPDVLCDDSLAGLELGSAETALADQGIVVVCLSKASHPVHPNQFIELWVVGSGHATGDRGLERIMSDSSLEVISESHTSQKDGSHEHKKRRKEGREVERKEGRKREVERKA